LNKKAPFLQKTKMIRIEAYTEATKDHIRELNYEWLEKYFSVEPNDVLQLNDPQQYILDKGGYVFYAFYDDKIAGTFSLLKIDDKTFELGKMATNAAFQGKGIGNAMLKFCLEKARKFGAEKIFLFSNTKLKSAIHLYEKYGFEQVPMEETHYVRSD
jgi:ribosomal protein S18 acetylase RimI-like enzyme